MNWKPIESAPKDGTKIMLFCPILGVVCPGRWDDNRHYEKPRPYWTHWGERIWGTLSMRDDQPTHWCELPSPPEEIEVMK